MEITKDEKYQSLEIICILSASCLAMGYYFDNRALLIVTLLLLIIGIFLKSLSVLIARSWMKLSTLLGFINTRVLLTIIYYLILTPIAILYRFFNGDFLQIKKNNARSFWHKREYQYSAEDLKKLW